MPVTIKFVDKAEKIPEIKGTPKVPKEFSKKMISKDGKTIIYYIEKNYGWQHKLWPKMLMSSIHPIDKDFVEITIPIQRID